MVTIVVSGKKVKYRIQIKNHNAKEDTKIKELGNNEKILSSR